VSRESAPRSTNALSGVTCSANGGSGTIPDDKRCIMSSSAMHIWVQLDAQRHALCGVSSCYNDCLYVADEMQTCFAFKKVDFGCFRTAI
jgi:hypothetical protein